MIEALAPWLPGLAGDYAKTAVLVGACVEWGGSPMALVDVRGSTTSSGSSSRTAANWPTQELELQGSGADAAQAGPP